MYNVHRYFEFVGLSVFLTQCKEMFGVTLGRSHVTQERGKQDRLRVGGGVGGEVGGGGESHGGWELPNAGL